MNITRREWQNYTQRLKGLSDRAARLVEEYIAKNGLSDMDALIRYAVLVCDKYSEAAGALSAEMYDETVAAENQFRPPADPVLPPSYGEVAKAMNGVHKHSMNPAEYGGAVGRLVKRTGADTSLMNALRDGAEFAWVPNGDTCAFCMTLASNGWQRMSKKALKNGHAEHIHPNCDCTYAIRVDGKSSVEGYDPEEYRRLYYGAEGDTPQARINYMRRQQYAADPEKYRSQARAAYELRKGVETGNTGDIIKLSHADFFAGVGNKVLEAKYKDWIGDNKYDTFMSRADGEEAKRYIRTAFRKTSIIGDGGTADARRFEKETGLNLGRNGGNHQKKVEDLIRQIRKSLRKTMSKSDKAFLTMELKKLEEVL